MSIEYKKSKDGSYVHNCYLVRRDGDASETLFHQNGDDNMSVFLNGYAIIPLEQYFDLKGERGNDGDNWPDEALKRIEEADKQLREPPKDKQ